MRSAVRVGLYCESDLIGGAERSMLTLAASYVGPADLVVLSPSKAIIDAAEALVPGVERRHLETVTGSAHSFFVHRRALAAANLDVLQVTLPSPFAARLPILAAYSLRIPTIGVQQLVLAPQRRRGAWLVRGFAAPLACTVAVGERSARDLVRLYGLKDSTIEVVHNGVTSPGPQAVRLDGPRPIIGCVARYESQKRIDRLIKAVAEVPNVQLHLVGAGSLRSELADLIKRLELVSRVTLGSWQENARATIASFDVFVLTSEVEAFPLTIVEAMLAHTPVVATDVGSVSEAISDQETGLLVRSGDHEGLVRSIKLLLDDPALAEDLASNAYDRARDRFTAETMAAKYGAIWQRLAPDCR